MTDNSNQKDGKRQQPERAESAPSTSSDPLQLDLFERWTGDGGRTQETSYESKPSRDFILLPASALAPDLKPTDSSRASAQSASAPSSKGEEGHHD
jgi:hypothetical protein